MAQGAVSPWSVTRWLRPFRGRDGSGHGSGPRPEARAYVVGDIHGRRDLLETLLTLIDAHQQAEPQPADLVFVGDYIDRGPDSAGVLAFLEAFAPGEFRKITCLRGNHEQMLLDFLGAPGAPTGTHWLRNGGDATAWSFGLATPDDNSDTAMAAFGAALDAALPGTLRDWIASRPLLWASGDLIVAHAGLDHDLPPEQQSQETLLWSRPVAGRRRSDGLWVAHGHTVTRPACVTDRRIAVDTGAVFTGLLTAAIIDPDGRIRFLDTSGRPPQDALAPDM